MINEINSENKLNKNNTEDIVTVDDNKINIFKQTVKNWLDIDNDIRTLENAIKDRKKKRNSSRYVFLLMLLKGIKSLFIYNYQVTYSVL